MSVDRLIVDWKKIIKKNTNSARVVGGIGVARLKNGKPSVATLEPTGEVRNGRQVFKATLQHQGGIVSGGELVSDIPLSKEQLQDIQEKNRTAVEKYVSLTR